jgi:Uma2 family endonuclease
MLLSCNFPSNRDIAAKRAIIDQQRQTMIARLIDRDLELPAASSGLGPAFSIPASAFSAAGFRRWLEAERQPRFGSVAYRAGKVYVKDLVRGAAFSIPRSALSPAGFRLWAFSGEYPEYGKVQYIAGEIYIDMNAESINAHAKVKLEVTHSVNKLVKANNWGQVYPDGTLVICELADISNEPDACYCSWETLKSGRVRETNRKGGDEGELVALYGSVDWVLEVLSPKSVRKDTVVLRDKYFRAGVREYWLIDARRTVIDFQILNPGRTGFEAQPRRGGWSPSAVFQRKFSLQRRDYQGFWRYDLLLAPLARGK